MPGIIASISVSKEMHVSEGQEIMILEAMKMENAISAPCHALIKKICVSEGQVVEKGDILLEYLQQESNIVNDPDLHPDKVEILTRPIEELRWRKEFLKDIARPEASKKRIRKGQNTARQNIELLTDYGTFKEYGGFVIAAQRTRRSIDDLIQNTPADGLITGIGSVNGALFTECSNCLIMAYDFTVLAGTQGTMNHMKMDRVIALAKDKKLPVILFAEGGGGRPGDVDVQTIAGLFISTFTEFAALKDVVPTLSIVSGYCFAGNAALAGISDVIIGTKNSSLGMGGPAMIKGGGLGDFHPGEVGPPEIQTRNGVIDILVANESEAVQVAKKYLGFWQGRIKSWSCSDQDELQDIIPINRKKTFDIRYLIEKLLDRSSLLELKKDFGQGMITCLGRIEGFAVGIMANDSAVEAGAITAENSIKASGFLDTCNRYAIPVVSLIDTPGIMVGPEAEKEGTVRHSGNLFVSGARFKPPFLSIVLRRAYGLGAMAMMGGSTRKSHFTISWPTGEFGAMGLEGAVQLGYKKELDAVKDPVEKEKFFDQMVAKAYERGKALSMATMYEIDDVIEPRDTRSWIVSGIKSFRKNK